MNQNNQINNNEVPQTTSYNNSQAIYNQSRFSWENNVDMRGFPPNNNRNNNFGNTSYEYLKNRNSNNETNNSRDNDNINRNYNDASNTNISNYSRHQQQHSINPQIDTNIQPPQEQQLLQKEAVSNSGGTPIVYPSHMSKPVISSTSITSPYINVNEPTQYKSPNSTSTNTTNNNNGETFFSEGMPQDAEKLRPQPLPPALFSYPIRKYISNLAILKFHDMVNMINNAGNNLDKLEYWQHFVKEMFTPYATVRYSKTSNIDYRKFNFLVSLIPVIFVTLWKLGVVRIDIALQQIKCEVLSNSCIFISCPKATLTYHYADASYVTYYVRFKGIYSSSLKLEFGDLCMHGFVPGIEWNALERLLSNQQSCYEIFRKLSNIDDSNTKNKSTNGPINGENSELTNKLNTTADNNPNKLNDNSYKKETFNNTNDNLNHRNTDNLRDKKIPPNFDAIAQLRSCFGVFKNVSVCGSQEGLTRVMQVSNVMSALKNLRAYQKIHGIDSPVEALEAYVQKNYNDSNLGTHAMHSTNIQNNNRLSPDSDDVTSPRYSVNPNIN